MRRSLIVALITFAVFGSAISFEFLSFDDQGHTVENRPVRDLDLSKIWSEPHFGLYIPVTNTVWAFTAALSEAISGVSFSPALFHSLNVILHVANALLVLWLFLQLGMAPWFAAGGALIFSLHPVQVESVAWVSSFRDVLSAFWGFVFLNLGLRFQNSLKSLIALTPLLALSVLSKPSGVVFAMFLGLIWFWRERRLSISQIGATVVWLSVALGFTVLAKNIQPDASLEYLPSWSERLAIAAEALSFYVAKIFFPLRFAADYGMSASSLSAQWQAEGYPWFWVGLAFCLLAAVVYSFCRKDRDGLGFSFALLALFPYLGFVPFNFQNVSIVADRYLYVAMVGLAFAFVVWISRRPDGSARFGLAFVVLLCFGFTFRQLWTWRNDRALYTHMATVNPKSYIAQNGLGVIQLKAGQLTTAIEHFQKAVELRPGYYFARYNLAKALQMSGDTRGSLLAYIQTINSQPRYVPTYLGLALLLFEQKRFQEAFETASRGLQLDPASEELNALKTEIEKMLPQSP